MTFHEKPKIFTDSLVPDKYYMIRYSKDTNYKKLIQSKRWQAVRNAYIKAHPTCECCGKLATEVHHIVPLNKFRNDPLKMEMMAFDEENLQALCRECHRKKHVELESFRHRRENAEAYHKEKLDNFLKNLENW